MAKYSSPVGYEKKYADFIRMVQDAQRLGVEAVVVDQPWVIGDNYEEIIESLSRLAEANLALKIVRRAR